MEIGKPIKKYVVVPLKAPVQAPEPPIPERRKVPEKQPVREPERV